MKIRISEAGIFGGRYTPSVFLSSRGYGPRVLLANLANCSSTDFGEIKDPFSVFVAEAAAAAAAAAVTVSALCSEDGDGDADGEGDVEAESFAFLIAMVEDESAP
ncbi:hypothetical protein WICPIJ_009377 [Wickerhamomyces pijperi]|uniref:Uncharacterized protein n=1 Tax=Wickerhamomyces pijperi TaxID=599730 RepID=A0A9P8TE39_WICPI|nr:hypothetical protein WICPIJ_009377 [Wickerhamomyces pijperi]